MRDINKNKEYFYQYLGEKENLFKMMDLAMRQRASADDFMGENDKGIINAYKGLSLNYMLYMIAQYSAGESIETIRKSYKKTLQYSEKIWKPNSSYVDCLWLVSIGVLLDISADEICLLNHIVKKNSKEDKLISFFMEYLNKEKNSDQCFFMALPYKKLDEYIEGVKRDVTLIESYLENYWYDAHNDMAWYDSHKDKSNTYFGYWSFETGAIAKILNLDDSSLKNAPYYPYDLVHYKE